MSKTPKLYNKIKAILKDKILLGEYKPGDRLPCSVALAKEYSVSLITIRRVLSELRNDGLIQLCQGKNAQVASRRIKETRALIKNSNCIKSIFVILVTPACKTISKQAGPWTYNIFSGIQMELLSSGTPFTFIPVEDPAEILGIINNNLDSCSGVIIFTSNIHRMIEELISEIPKPYCLISGQRESNSVTPDYYKGAIMVAKYFLSMHMRHFAILQGNTLTGVSIQKLRGMQETLLSNGIAPEKIHIINSHENTSESAQSAVLEFLNSNRISGPLGIFANGDFLALGAINACKNKGLKLIQDYMVIGGTGLKDAESSSPKLSVLEDPMFDTGVEAARMILKMIEEKCLAAQTVLLPMKLIHRETTLQ